MYKRSHEPFPRRQTLAEAISLVIAAIEADPEFDAEYPHAGLRAAIHRALPGRSQDIALAGPGERDWWHGVVEDRCLPYLELGMGYGNVIEALRQAHTDAS
ncbi:MAG: hypothetical protein ACRDRS_22810 [Pseudonocardiaceae bacterium]